MFDLWSFANCDYASASPPQQLLESPPQNHLLTVVVSLVKFSSKFCNRGFEVNQDKCRGV